MRTYGFDVDGVISKAPWFVPTRFPQRFLRWLCEIRIFWKIYNRFLRRENPEVCKVIRELKKRGDRVIIISANLEWRRPEIEDWLKKQQIPYDKLILAPSTNTQFALWKSEMVEREEYSYYLEDRPEIVVCINKRALLVSKRAPAICYRGQSSEEILKVLVSNTGTFLFLHKMVN